MFRINGKHHEQHANIETLCAEHNSISSFYNRKANSNEILLNLRTLAVSESHEINTFL